MNIEQWRKVLGKSVNDKAFKALLAASGVKKIPKLDKDDVSVIVDLKGHGMGLKLVDEAWMKNPDPHVLDPNIGNGPLILTFVCAYMQRKKNNDLYKGTIPYGLKPEMTQDDVRKILGTPIRNGDNFDSWSREGVEFLVAYGQEKYREKLGLSHITYEVPYGRY